MLRRSCASVEELAVGKRPLTGVANALDVIDLVGPLAVDDDAAGGIENGPEHRPVLAGRRIDPVVAGAVRYIRMANDMDLRIEQREASSDGFGWHAIRAGEDFLAGLA
ncbi:MAG: hypothetical protein ACK55Z_34155, partial [bacterium]